MRFQVIAGIATTAFSSQVVGAIATAILCLVIKNNAVATALRVRIVFQAAALGPAGIAQGNDLAVATLMRLRVERRPVAVITADLIHRDDLPPATLLSAWLVGLTAAPILVRPGGAAR